MAIHHTFTTTYFDNMWVHFFLGKKLMNIFDITQKYSQGYFMIIYVNLGRATEGINANYLTF